MPAITVIVPFYNAGQYIERCIQSLLTQHYPRDDYEIIMVNNNSTDDSLTIIKKYSAIRCLNEKTQGAYSARNLGILEAKGDIIAFTDPDCVPDAHWLHHIAKVMRTTNATIVLGSRQPGKKSFFLSLLGNFENVKKEHVFQSDIKEKYFGHTNNMAVRRTLFKQVGLFLEKLRGADTIFVQSAIERHSPDTVRFCDEMSVRHLEIRSLANYYSKILLYGRSAGEHKELVQVRHPSFQEVIFILQKTVSQNGNPWGSMLFLVSLLTVSRVCWLLGKLSGMINFKDQSHGEWPERQEGSAYLLPK